MNQELRQADIRKAEVKHEVHMNPAQTSLKSLLMGP